MLHKAAKARSNTNFSWECGVRQSEGKERESKAATPKVTNSGDSKRVENHM